MRVPGVAVLCCQLVLAVFTPAHGAGASKADAGSSACGRDEAFNRMMAISQFSMRLQAALPDPLKQPQEFESGRQRLLELSEALAPAGPLLAEQRYAEACARYDEVARRYGIDYAREGVRPLSAYVEEARHPPAGCDLAEASRRAVWLSESFFQYAERRQLDRDALAAYGEQMESVGLTMQRDPVETCAIIERIAARYGLVRER